MQLQHNTFSKSFLLGNARAFLMPPVRYRRGTGASERCVAALLRSLMPPARSRRGVGRLSQGLSAGQAMSCRPAFRPEIISLGNARAFLMPPVRYRRGTGASERCIAALLRSHMPPARSRRGVRASDKGCQQYYLGSLQAAIAVVLLWRVHAVPTQ